MTDVIGAEMWQGKYVCGKCGAFIHKAKLIGTFEQTDRYGEIRACVKCGNAIQLNYSKKRKYKHAR